MKKNIIIGVVVLIIIVGAIFIFSGDKGDNGGQLNNSDNGNQVGGSSSMVNICKYFSKDLIEAAIGKPILKMESPFTDGKTCFYYTTYSETYDHTPYGDKPGGAKVVVVYDDEDFAHDKAYNETHGTVYETDATIRMDNFVAHRRSGEIWSVVLVLGGDKYIRMHSIDDAVTGDDLVKIATKLAEFIK